MNLLFSIALGINVLLVQSACPVIDHSKLIDNVAPCSLCTQNNFVNGNQEVCGYCYQTQSCHEITALNMLTGPCPVPPTPASSSDDGSSSSGKTDPSYDYSLGLNGQCDCRPEKFTNCTSCANLKHLGCTWVTKGKQFRQWKVPILGSEVEYNQDSWLNNTCQSVLSPEVKHYELKNDRGDMVFSLNTRTEVFEYFWAQCSMSNETFMLLLTGIVFLCFLAAIGACFIMGCYKMCCRRTQRRRIQYKTPATRRTSLLDEYGRPVVVVSAGQFA